MSEFCGKCDVYDSLGNATDEFLQRSNFFIYSTDGRSHRLEINSQKDLAKYYPYIIGSMGYSKERATVFISSQCFIDREESEMIGWVKRDLVKYYKKCKRNKIPYSVNDALKKVCWRNPADWERELARRVGECGEKAETEDLHRALHEYYRDYWYKELMRQGYHEGEAYEWVYGWRRYLDERKKKEGKAEDIESNQD